MLTEETTNSSLPVFRLFISRKRSAFCTPRQNSRRFCVECLLNLGSQLLLTLLGLHFCDLFNATSAPCPLEKLRERNQVSFTFFLGGSPPRIATSDGVQPFVLSMISFFTPASPKRNRRSFQGYERAVEASRVSDGERERELDERARSCR
jgi:hypothetical protein